MRGLSTRPWDQEAASAISSSFFLEQEEGVEGCGRAEKDRRRQAPFFSPEEIKEGRGLLYRGGGKLPLIRLDTGEWKEMRKWSEVK